VDQLLTRQFHVTAAPEQLFALVQRPLLAPDYLNFLTDIAQVPHNPMEANWLKFQVNVTYRHLFHHRDFVLLHIDKMARTARLRHNGRFAQFDAQFTISEQLVTLNCTYRTKVSLAKWLIASALDRVLCQVAMAMDRYACQFCVTDQRAG
jgi:hypothetical protein